MVRGRRGCDDDRDLAGSGRVEVEAIYEKRKSVQKRANREQRTGNGRRAASC